jgi:hypothetical protein
MGRQTTRVQNISGAFLKALAASTPKCRPTDYDTDWHFGGDTPEVPVTEVVAGLKVEVNRIKRSVNRRLIEWKNDQWRATLETLGPLDDSQWWVTKREMRLLRHTLVKPRGIALRF